MIQPEEMGNARYLRKFHYSFITLMNAFLKAILPNPQPPVEVSS